MNEIHQRGPIVCSIATDNAIMYGYRSGVYDGANSTDVDHNVEVVGWGVQDNKQYWCAVCTQCDATHADVEADHEADVTVGVHAQAAACEQSRRLCFLCAKHAPDLKQHADLCM
jgi:hypothetical protein